MVSTQRVEATVAETQQMHVCVATTEKETGGLQTRNGGQRQAVTLVCGG